MGLSFSALSNPQTVLRGWNKEHNKLIGSTSYASPNEHRLASLQYVFHRMQIL